MKNTDGGKPSRRNALLLAAVALLGVLTTPLASSAADIGGSSFFVKAQNSSDSTRFAVKPAIGRTPATPAPTASATPTATPTPAAPVAKILKSYTFESDQDYSGWSGAPRMGTSSPSPHTGRGYLYYSFIGKGTYYSSPPRLTYVVGQTYTVTAWVYNENGYGSTTQLVAQNDPSSSSPVISAVNTWTQVSVTFVAKSTSPSINFVEVFPGSSSFLRIDDVTISQIS